MHLVFELDRKYTVLQMFMQVLFWAGNQGNHQNFDPSTILATQETLTDFHGNEAKKIQNGRLKKTECFNSENFQY